MPLSSITPTEVEMIPKRIYTDNQTKELVTLLALGKVRIDSGWFDSAIYQKADKTKEPTILTVTSEDFRRSFTLNPNPCRCEELDLNPSECPNFVKETFKCRLEQKNKK